MRINTRQLQIIVPRVIALLFLTITFSGSVYAQEPENSKHLFSNKYYHDVQIGSTLIFTEFGAFPFFDLTTCHGINFTKRFSAGIGVSTMYFLTLTPFIYGRFNFKEQGKSKKSIPYISLKAGYFIFLKKYESDENSINLEPCVGYSFVNKRGKKAWAVFIAGNYLENRIFPKIGVGLEF